MRPSKSSDSAGIFEDIGFYKLGYKNTFNSVQMKLLAGYLRNFTKI